MIYSNKREVVAIYKGDHKSISAVYKGDGTATGRLVGQAVRSCFGRGYGINEKPWINTDPGKNKE